MEILYDKLISECESECETALTSLKVSVAQAKQVEALAREQGLLLLQGWDSVKIQSPPTGMSGAKSDGPLSPDFIPSIFKHTQRASYNKKESMP